MKTRMTHHATVRSQQRGIPLSAVELICEYGIESQRPGNAREYIISKRNRARAVSHLKRLIRQLERSNGKAVLVSDHNGDVITAYNVR